MSQLMSYADNEARQAPVGLDSEAAFRQFRPAIRGMLQRMGVPARMLEDVSQDVFLVAHHKRGEFRGQSTPRTWVMGIAVNLALNHRRRVSRCADEPALYHEVNWEAQPCNNIPSALDVAALHQARRLLEESTVVLGEQERRLWKLINTDGLNVRKAALLMNISPSTAYSLLTSAKAKLTRQLARQHIRVVDPRKPLKPR